MDVANIFWHASVSDLTTGSVFYPPAALQEDGQAAAAAHESFISLAL